MLGPEVSNSHLPDAEDNTGLPRNSININIYIYIHIYIYIYIMLVIHGSTGAPNRHLGSRCPFLWVLGPIGTSPGTHLGHIFVDCYDLGCQNGRPFPGPCF